MYSRLSVRRSLFPGIVQVRDEAGRSPPRVPCEGWRRNGRTCGAAKYASPSYPIYWEQTSRFLKLLKKSEDK